MAEAIAGFTNQPVEAPRSLPVRRKSDAMTYYLSLLLRFAVLVAAGILASAALAADAEIGKRLAEMRCAGCHSMVARQRREVSDAPPFETIAQKHRATAEMLAFAILDPHPRMNMTLTRREAEDIAAYIVTLAR
jgi:mono/diheme cytochrome c family protein